MRRHLPALAAALVSLFLLCLPEFSAAQPTSKEGAGQATSVAASRHATNVAIITIHGEIDEKGVMARSVQRRIDTAVRAGADAIVFDINSPGGELSSVLRICNAIKQCPVQNTVAWINPDAYSGGAIVALACREIVVNSPATFGDSQVIGSDRFGRTMSLPVNDPQLLKKFLPPLISEVLDSARRHNKAFGGYIRDEYLVQSIVANDVELWFVRHKETGVEMCIDREEFRMLFPGQSASGPTRLGGARGTGTPTQALPPADPSLPTPPPTATPGAPANSRMLGAVATEIEQNQTLTTDRPRISASDAGKWELIDKVSDGSSTALFKADDMAHYNLAANETSIVNGVPTLKPIKTDADIKDFFQAKNLQRFDSSWSEGLVLFLTNFIVRGVLIVIFLIAFFIEVTHPGAILPGLVALVALLALLSAPLLIGMASWWEVAAILTGLVLIGVEAFVIPGFGVTGVLGIVLLFAGMVATFVPQGSGIFPGTQRAQDDLLYGTTTILLAGTSAVVGMYFVAKHFGSIPIIGRLVLKDPGADEESEDFLAAIDPDAGLEVRPGDVGTTLTPMRPAGRVEVGEKVIDAVAEFGYIAPGSKVRVVSVSAMRIGVEAVPNAPTPANPTPPAGPRGPAGPEATG